MRSQHNVDDRNKIPQQCKKHLQLILITKIVSSNNFIFLNIIIFIHFPILDKFG